MDADPRAVLELLRTGRDRVARAWTGDKVEVALVLQRLGDTTRAGPCRVCLLTALWLDPDTGVRDYDTGTPSQTESLVRTAAQRHLTEAIWPAGPPGGDRLADWNDHQANVAPVLAAYDRAITAAEREVG